MKTMQHQSKGCEVCDKQLSKSSIETGQSAEGLCKNKILQRYTIPEVVHHGLTCNGCNVTPIKGNKCFCLSCPNLNLCKKCGESRSHEHDLILTSSKL